ncbi:MAG: YadA-like family protein [Synergistaceae bacterium]|nr:YadA-like family protein [Candidatus Equadaptatus faecalis]
MKSFKKLAAILMLVSFIFGTVSPALADASWVTTGEGVGTNAMKESTAAGASGNNSVAMGYQTNSTGDYSTSMGYKTYAGANLQSTIEWTKGWGEYEIQELTTAFKADVTSGDVADKSAAEILSMDESAFSDEDKPKFTQYKQDAITLAKSNYVGDYSTAMGWNTTASGQASTAMGWNTTASGEDSTAMGWNTTASGQASTAMGYGSQAVGYGSFAGGGYRNPAGSVYNGGTAYGESSFAFGEGAVTGYRTGSGTEDDPYEYYGDHSIAIGRYANASSAYSVAIGTEVNSSGGYSTALGYQATASGMYSTALGHYTNASGYYSTAMGCYTNASGNYSTAMGRWTNSSGNYSVAMGISTSSSGNYSVAMGAGTTASGRSSVSSGFFSVAVGEGSFAGGGYWNSSTDKADGGTAYGRNSFAFGAGAVAGTRTGSGTAEDPYVYGGDFSVAMGKGATASGEGSTAMGSNTTAGGDYSTAIGYVSVARGDGSFAGGGDGTDFGGTAYGRSSFAFGEGAIAGDSSDEEGTAGTIALGNGAQATHANSVALGNNAVSKEKQNISSATIGTKTYNFTSGTTAEGVVSVGDTGHLKQIVNVANGAITATSTDAVNGGQLYAIVEAMSALEAKTLKDEIVKENTPEPGQTTTQGIAANAADGLTVTKKVTDSTTGDPISTDTTAVTSDGVTVGDGTNVSTVAKDKITVTDGNGKTAEMTPEGFTATDTSAGTPGTTVKFSTDGISAGNQQIADVADGNVAPGSTDAVNGGQLYGYTTVKIKSGETTSGNVTTAEGIVLEAGDNIELTAAGNSIKISSTGGTGADVPHYDKDASGERLNSITLKDKDGGTASQVAIKNVASAGTLAADNTNAATGADIYNEVRPATDGEYVKTGNTTAQNLTALDTQVKNNTDTIAAITGGTGTLDVAELKIAGDTYITPDGIDANGKKIINVADGDVAEGSTDAVNGGQLYDAITMTPAGNYYADKDSVTTAVSKIDSAIGKLQSGTILDGSTVAADLQNLEDAINGIEFGEVTIIRGKKAAGDKAAEANAEQATAAGYNSAAGAQGATAVGYGAKAAGEYSTVVGHGNTVTGNGSGAFGSGNEIAGANNFVLGNNVKIEPTVENSVALGNNSTVTESNVVSVGSPGAERRISNVADGVNPTDVATKGQMDTLAAATNQAIGDLAASTNQALGSMQNEISSVSGEVREVGAISAALAGLHYAEPSGEEGDRLSGAVAYGGYRGESAAAVGLAYKPNPNLMVSASTSVGNSQNAYNAGVSYRFGKGETAVTRAALQKQVKYLNDKTTAQGEENAALKAENAAQNKKIQLLEQGLEELKKLIKK